MKEAAGGPVLVVTGPPGAGKSTVARRVAERAEKAACVECDWFFTTIVRGHIAPWLGAADAQNRAVLLACAATAAELALGGYTVVVDGVIGPWYLDLVTAVWARSALEVHYVVLRPGLDITVARGTGRREDERVPGHPALVDEGPIRFMWERFQDLGRYERHVVDTGSLDAEQTAALVWSRFCAGTDRL